MSQEVVCLDHSAAAIMITIAPTPTQVSEAPDGFGISSPLQSLDLQHQDFSLFVLMSQSVTKQLAVKVLPPVTST